MEGYTKRLLFIEAIIILVVVCGAFFIPFKEIPVYTVETYSVTEYERQAYKELEEYEVGRKTQEDPILDLRLELNGNQWWRLWVKQEGDAINFYASSWDLEEGNPMLTLPVKPESAIIMDWATMWPSSKEVHGVVLNEDEFSIPGSLTNDPEAIRDHIIDSAIEHHYVPIGEVSCAVEDKTLMIGLIHEDTEKTDTPQVINVRFAHQWDEIETATREVTKRHTVPVEVEKQRPVILTPRYSMWQLIFSGKFIPLIKGEL